MKKTRFTVVLLALAALAAVGYSAAGATSPAQSVDACCDRPCSATCDTGCCAK